MRARKLALVLYESGQYHHAGPVRVCVRAQDILLACEYASVRATAMGNASRVETRPGSDVTLGARWGYLWRRLDCVPRRQAR